MLFQEVGSRKIVADFSGGTLSSDGGVLLLRQVDRSLRLTRRLAACFGDQRDQRFVEHSVPELLAQRLYGQVLGYEDINDHEQLRVILTGQSSLFTLIQVEFEKIVSASSSDPVNGEREHFAKSCSRQNETVTVSVV